MSQKLVSVVVPVYNVEAYLPDCVDSILAQTYSDLQVILVDDGSTDGSAGICDAYAEKDERVCVFHQENQGTAAARKNGVHKAQGEYLCFVDADDVAAPEMVKFFVESIGDCDVVTSGCISKHLDGTETIRFDAIAEGTYEMPEQLDEFLENMIMIKGSYKDGILPFVWGKMYRTHMMKEVINVSDPTLFYDEDRVLMLHYMLKCNAIRVTHETHYEYRLRSDSAVNSIHPDMLRNLHALYKSLEKAFANHPKKDDLMRQLQMFVVSRLHIIPKWMGFCPEARMVRYLFQPYMDLRGKKIVLYGAGVVGKDYYLQLQAAPQVEVVLWADKNWKDYRESRYVVDSPEKVIETEFDFLLVAVNNPKVAEEIKNDWISKGIPGEKILWIAPVVLEMY